jgi:serine acetyltransferase
VEKRPEDDQPIVIEDDVWIGSCAIVLKGTRIGRGAIVGAGALVTKDVLPYTVVAGSPARRIGVRFGGDVEALIEHERCLYRIEERLPRLALERLSVLHEPSIDSADAPTKR